MATPEERDFPKGHPKASDYDPDSPEAIEWARKNIHPAGERDWPVDHPKAVDTEGNTNTVATLPGVDPAHPELEPFTGRTPAQVAAERAVWEKRKYLAMPSPEREPTIAPAPPTKPGDTRPPSGQPGEITPEERTLLQRLRDRIS
jgi:hypothetical protein